MKVHTELMGSHSGISQPFDVSLTLEMLARSFIPPLFHFGSIFLWFLNVSLSWSFFFVFFFASPIFTRLVIYLPTFPICILLRFTPPYFSCLASVLFFSPQPVLVFHLRCLATVLSSVGSCVGLMDFLLFFCCLSLSYLSSVHFQSRQLIKLIIFGL